MEIYLLLVGAGFLAGAMNAVAGGGSFITFPTLVLAGLPSVPANASSTVALWPGAIAGVVAYRNDPQGFPEISTRALLIISVTGGLMGGLLLLATPSPTFDRIVPWLLLVSTVTFAFGQRMGVLLRRWVEIGPRALLVVQFILCVYSGYFGGGVSIMMLAAWSLLLGGDIVRLNPTRILMVAASNSTAILAFIVAGQVWWPQTLAVLVGAVAGGYLGASIARRTPPKTLRAAVITIATVMTAVFFYRAFQA